MAQPTKPTNSMEVDSGEDDDKYANSAACTLFGSCFMMDTDTANVEVVLSKDRRQDDVATEANPAEDEKDERELSPLPFLRNETETSTMSFFETLLQLPIAPCSPQDVVE